MYYNSVAFVLPMLMTYYIGRFQFKENNMNNYISMANTGFTLISYLMYCYFSSSALIYNLVFNVGVSYFVYDSIIILLHYPKFLMFVPHHILTASLFLLLDGNKDILFMTYFYFELSNLFIVLYDMYRKTEYKDIIKPYMVSFYVPYRMFLVPYSCYKLLLTTSNVKMVFVQLLLLSIMSIGYSFKLLKYKFDYTVVLPIYLEVELLVHFLPLLPYKYILVPYVCYNLIKSCMCIKYGKIEETEHQ